jgi:hypothetical protein
MSNISLIQTSLTSGEISPFLASRTDLQQYANAAQEITNLYVRPHGSVTKRPGSVFVAEVKASANDTRILPFTYSSTDAYVVEMGAGYFRFFRDGGQILSTAAITNGTFTTDLTGWTDGNTGTGSSTQTGGVMRLAGGAAGVGARTQGIAYVGTAQYTLSFTVATNTCEYRIGTTSGGTEIASGTGAIGANTVNFTPTTAGTVYIQFRNANNNNSDVDSVSLNNPVYQIDNPYSQGDIEDVKYVQSYDYLFFVHSSYTPRQLTRSGHAQWTMSAITFTDGPYYDITDLSYGGLGSGITISASAATGTVTLTASAPLFVSTDVGRLIRYRSVNSVAWGWGTISAYTNSTTVTCVVTRTFTASGTASTEWRLGYWSATTGYPGVIAFNEQRMVFARSRAKQQTVWFSVSGDFFNFCPDDTNHKDAVVDSAAMTYTIADNKGNVIQWMASQKVFFLGTSGGVWVARASSQGDAITPTSITIVPIINEAASPTDPLVTRTAVIYPQYFGRKLLEIGYQFSDDTYRGADLALLAEHRTHGKIKRLSNQVQPNYIVWAVMQDGTLSAVTYIREQNIVGWHQTVLGGTDVLVKDVATIPGANEDQTYLLVSRTINGSTKQYIEYLSELFIEQDVEDSVFVDCSITYSGTATTTLTGLGHLEGETVSVFADGGEVVATVDVTGGSITLQDPVEEAVVGLPYASILKTNALNTNTPTGPTTGRRGRVHKAEIQFYRSFGGKIGMDANNLDTIPEYSSEFLMDEPLPLATGISEFRLPTDYTFLPHIYIKHDLPVPFCITGITYQLSVSSK